MASSPRSAPREQGHHVAKCATAGIRTAPPATISSWAFLRCLTRTIASLITPAMALSSARRRFRHAMPHRFEMPRRVITKAGDARALFWPVDTDYMLLTMLRINRSAPPQMYRLRDYMANGRHHTTSPNFAAALLPRLPSLILRGQARPLFRRGLAGRACHFGSQCRKRRR